MLNVVLFVAATNLALSDRGYPPFAPGDEAILYGYHAEAGRKDATRTEPVAISLTAFVESQRVAKAKEARGDPGTVDPGEFLPVVPGTRCRVIRFRRGGLLDGVVVRDCCEIQLLNGEHRGKNGWVPTRLLRERPKLVVDPPEPITDENRDSPRLLGLMILAQDKLVFREIVAADLKATAAARTLPKGNPRRLARYEQVYRRELRIILDRYGLDETTANRIREWGEEWRWPTRDADPAKAVP